MSKSLAKIRSGLEARKEGLPAAAFAIVSDANDPATWKLPHHTRAILRALKGRLDIEQTVDWERMAAAVAALSPGGYRGRRVEAPPEQLLAAARHLAAHYRAAGRDLPPSLAQILEG
jgi:hypothetical protein